MLRSTATLFLSLLLASPLTAQPTDYDSTPPPHKASVHAPPTDSTAPDSDPSSDEWWTPGAHVSDRVVDGIGPVGGSAWPHRRESSVYHTPPPIRYNRVEGLVLGIHRDPLRLGSSDRARLYGQLGYAFALDDVRYKVGVESQIIRDERRGLKLGIAYQDATLTSDRWKTSYAENSLAGIGFRYDFFDYYAAEGISLYAVQALSSTVHVTAGFRAEDHRSLAENTNWSLFKAGSFRPNPAAKEGRLNAAFFGINGGKIRNVDDLPSGAAIHLEALIGRPFGGDIVVNRYEADGRVFLPLTHDTRLGLRLRGGYATSQAPPQSQFRLGGIGSLRSYQQNAYQGTKMALANVEYIVDGATLVDSILDDVWVAGLFDAGWVGTPTDQFQMDEVLPSAGFSIGLDERDVRLDVSWPLREVDGAGTGPSVWLRITPNF